MSIKDLLQNEAKVNHLRVKVITNNGDKILVGDSSMLAICCATNNSYQKMIEGKCYMLLKPIKQDANHFIPNGKLKPTKVPDFPFSPKRTEISKLQHLLQPAVDVDINSGFNSKDQLKTFDDISKLAPKSEIAVIVVKIITISRDINGSYGIYNIAKIKDKNGDKMDLNLYSKPIRNKIKRGDVIEMKKIQITEYLKDGKACKRLATTSKSSGEKCSSIIETLFENVHLGDEKEEGAVLAIHDIYPYLSCSKCRKKIDVDDTLCTCGHHEDIHVIDFHCQFYIQVKKDEEIKVIRTFRRQTAITVQSQDPEDIYKLLDDKYLGNNHIFEWNIDKDNEDEALRMIMITETPQ